MKPSVSKMDSTIKMISILSLLMMHAPTHVEAASFVPFRPFFSALDPTDRDFLASLELKGQQVRKIAKQLGFERGMHANTQKSCFDKLKDIAIHRSIPVHEYKDVHTKLEALRKDEGAQYGKRDRLQLDWSFWSSLFSDKKEEDSKDFSDADSLVKWVQECYDEVYRERDRLAGKHKSSFNYYQGDLVHFPKPTNLQELRKHLKCLAFHMHVKHPNDRSKLVGWLHEVRENLITDFTITDEEMRKLQNALGEEPDPVVNNFDRMQGQSLPAPRSMHESVVRSNRRTSPKGPQHFVRKSGRRCRKRKRRHGDRYASQTRKRMRQSRNDDNSDRLNDLLEELSSSHADMIKPVKDKFRNLKRNNPEEFKEKLDLLYSKWMTPPDRVVNLRWILKLDGFDHGQSAKTVDPQYLTDTNKRKGSDVRHPRDSQPFRRRRHSVSGRTRPRFSNRDKDHSTERRPVQNPKQVKPRKFSSADEATLNKLVEEAIDRHCRTRKIPTKKGYVSCWTGKQGEIESILCGIRNRWSQRKAATS